MKKRLDILCQCRTAYAAVAINSFAKQAANLGVKYVCGPSLVNVPSVLLLLHLGLDYKAIQNWIILLV